MVKPDDMLRQAKGTVDNITELAARVTAMDRRLQAADQALDDACLRMAKALRIELGDCPLEDCTTAIETAGSRHRNLEAGLRHVLQTLIDPRFPDVALEEARIELEQLIGDTNVREDARKDSPEKAP